MDALINNIQKFQEKLQTHYQLQTSAFLFLNF